MDQSKVMRWLKVIERRNVMTSEWVYVTGDLDWLDNPTRWTLYKVVRLLEEEWDGPYKTVGCMNDLINRIWEPPNGKLRFVHINRLTLYKVDNDSLQEQEIRAFRLMKEFHKDRSTLNSTNCQDYDR